MRSCVLYLLVLVFKTQTKTDNYLLLEVKMKFVLLLYACEAVSSASVLSLEDNKRFLASVANFFHHAAETVRLELQKQRPIQWPELQKQRPIQWQELQKQQWTSTSVVPIPLSSGILQTQKLRFPLLRITQKLYEMRQLIV